MTRRYGIATTILGQYIIHMDMNEATAKALQAARAVSGLTFEELADKSGVPIATVFRIFGAKRDIKIPQLYALAKALGITVVELMSDAERIQKRDERNKISQQPTIPNQTNEIVNKSFVSDEDVADTIRKLASGMGVAAYRGDHKFDGDGDDPA